MLVHQVHDLIVHRLGRFVVRPDGRRRAVPQVTAHELATDAPQRLLDRRDLRQDVGAVPFLADHALEAADLTLISGDVRGVARAIKRSKATVRNIKQNLVWACAYNVALIPVAAGVLYPSFGILLSPIIAAAAMALSSVSVIGNAARLRSIRL